MARPKRNNAEYFTHYATDANERRVKALRAKFGAAGYGIYWLFWEAIADAENNRLPVGGLEDELLAADFGVSVTEMRGVLDFCCTLRLFVAENEGLLVGCPELDARLAAMYQKREAAKAAYEERKTKQKPAAAIVSVAETGVSVAETTQSRVRDRVESRVENNTPAADAASVPAEVKEDPAPFARFWEAYGKKKGDKDGAERKWKALDLPTRLSILNGLPAYLKETPDPQYRCAPVVFLNQKRWKAEDWNKALPAPPKHTPYTAPPSTAPQFATRADVDALWDDPVPTGYATTSFR